MKITYKCKCQDHERHVSVPDRVPNTDLMKWMNLVQMCIGYDHSTSSPACFTSTVEYAKIPVEGDGIGEAKVVN